MNKNKQKGSILKWLVIILAIIILASYFFNFSIQDFIENQQTQNNLNYIREHLVEFYQNNLSNLVEKIWQFLKENIFDNLLENLNNIEEGNSTFFENFTTNIQISEN